ncbi:MAG: SHOCT domain-containing protein [Microcella sp.]|uniref:SHOCT domain-containing protein n=1 Tax=Microcella sp. TaxID=1913979 RepID=UPI0024C8447F|nr:SHOCT domain-containing protein [Microcella sp.]UYN82727.1 MAG: SHOCT domain-containing protein [Microcella sp.]
MEGFLGNVWDLVLLFFISFAFIAYFITLFSVVVDLFRDESLSGGWKAVWLLFIWFVPFVTLFVYLIARGGGMAARSQAKAQKSHDAAAAYIRDVAGASPADEIAKAKALLADGTISQAEFDAIKAKALA